MSVCPLAYLKTTSKLQEIFCTCGCGCGSVLVWDCAVHCVLLVLWMTSCFHMVARVWCTARLMAEGCQSAGGNGAERAELQHFSSAPLWVASRGLTSLGQFGCGGKHCVARGDKVYHPGLPCSNLHRALISLVAFSFHRTHACSCYLYWEILFSHTVRSSVSGPIAVGPTYMSSLVCEHCPSRDGKAVNATFQHMGPIWSLGFELFAM